ncbi:MAG: hypothetical protein DSM106950_00590 [Stigonema ocellatum SAG 48.90 = DSM 106950]|nr:hypothetical protein [Stigonema ocellatum SAG 48.90 = DSM 106950]
MKREKRRTGVVDIHIVIDDMVTRAISFYTRALNSSSRLKAEVRCNGRSFGETSSRRYADFSY